MKKLQGIQYLRAIAAIGVVVFHACERIGGYHVVIGAAGVDIFFVISGFIMWVISEKRSPTPAAFMKERIARIGPAYWLATAVMVAGGLLGLFPNLVLTAEHVLASLFFLPAVSPSNGHVWPVLVQGWTLIYEMFFYAAFALALFLPSRWRLPSILAAFVSLVVIRQTVPAGDLYLDFYGRPIILEFVAGAIIGKAWLGGYRLGGLLSGILLALAACGFAAVQLNILPYDIRILAPSACLLVAATASLEAAGRLPFNRTLAYLGDGSYSIYLWHTLAISVVARASRILGLPAPLAIMACVAGGLVGGLLCYECVERPILRRLKGRRAAAGTVTHRATEAIRRAG